MRLKNSLPDTRCRIRQQAFPQNSPNPGRKVSFSVLLKASLTVEAAWAIPLFFLAVLSLISMMEIYGTYAEKVVQLQEKAETAGMYAGLAGEYAPEVIDLRDSFRYSPKWYPESLPAVTISARARVRPWTGRDASEGTVVSGNEAEKMVYVAEYGSVYHTSSQCYHLDLTVQAVGGSVVGSLRNSSGEIYHACETCVGSGGKNTTVYITPEGNRYHNSASCSGLKRTVRLVKASEAGGLPLCTECRRLEAAA